MKIPLFYCNIDNFGDRLNEHIFKKLIKLDIQASDIQTSFAIGIGSLMDMCLFDKKSEFINKPLLVFSTGFGFDEGGFFHNKDIILPEKLMRNVKCYALRGKLTLERMKKLTNEGLTAVAIGDGGLLASELINKNEIEQCYELGIVPHFADKENPIFEKIKKTIPNSIILDVTKEPIEFLKDLAKCKAVISTAMHPLIAADSLEIPNLWGRISDETTSRYKFYDYYSAFDIKKEPYNLLENEFNEDTLKNLIKNYDISKEKLEKIKKDLKEALKFIKKELIWKYYRAKFLKFISIFVPIKKLRRKIRII